MLPILHDLQERFGYIDDAAIPLIADALNISRAETLGVVSFYHDFRRAPVDGRGAEAVPRRILPGAWAARIWSRISPPRMASRSTSARARAAHVETVYCLGNCALSPAALLDGEPIGRLDRDRIDAIVADAEGRPQ